MRKSRFQYNDNILNNYYKKVHMNLGLNRTVTPVFLVHDSRLQEVGFTAGQKHLP